MEINESYLSPYSSLSFKIRHSVKSSGNADVIRVDGVAIAFYPSTTPQLTFPPKYGVTK